MAKKKTSRRSERAELRARIAELSGLLTAERTRAAAEQAERQRFYRLAESWLAEHGYDLGKMILYVEEADLAVNASQSPHAAGALREARRHALALRKSWSDMPRNLVARAVSEAPVTAPSTVGTRPLDLSPAELRSVAFMGLGAVVGGALGRIVAGAMKPPAPGALASSPLGAEVLSAVARSTAR